MISQKQDITENRNYTCVHSSLKRRTLFCGTSFAGVGILLLTYAGTAFPEATLQRWGWFFFLISGLLIAVGLVPYRRLCSLENNPSVLSTESGTALSLEKKGSCLFTLPFCSISKIGYLADPSYYGIVFWLKEAHLKKLHIPSVYGHIPRRLRSTGCHLFLPYFSERTFRQLTQEIRHLA
jgi:hypothetical protein